MSTARASKAKCDIRVSESMTEMVLFITLSSPSSEPTENSNQPVHKCNFPDCRSKATFKRKYDLDRHMKKHDPKTFYNCPAVDCKSRGNKAFYRADKFKVHILAAHNRDTLFACPVTGCHSSSVPLSGCWLPFHARNHYFEKSSFGSIMAQIEWPLPCPIVTCSAKLPLAELRVHTLLEHSDAERHVVRPESATYGFDFVTGDAICPVASCEKKAFPHLMALHDHLAGHLGSRTIDFSVGHSAEIKTASHPLWEKHCGRDSTWESCDMFVQAAEKMRDSSQDFEELRDCRELLHRLCPCITVTPIYDDFMPNVGQTWFRHR
jgi:hypothetical protein